MVKGSIKYIEKGNFKKLTTHLESLKETFGVSILNKYGRKGVDLLESVTPIYTGKTAASWYYEIDRENSGNTIILRFCNSNVLPDGSNVAMIIQMGHATQSGTWIEGRDYINPVLQPLFDELCEELWKEVKK